MKKFDSSGCYQRCSLCRFGKHSVPGGKGCCDLSRENRQGKVPRRNRGYDPACGSGDLFPLIRVVTQEIHSFTALTDDTWSVTVVGGRYKDDRAYYKPESNSYGRRNPKRQKVV